MARLGRGQGQGRTAAVRAPWWGENNPEYWRDARMLSADKLRSAARRFSVPGAGRMTKDELVEALEYTAWRIEGEIAHTAIREHRPEHGQPVGTCALCFRPLDTHPAPMPGRFGWPEEWELPFERADMIP